MLMPQTEWKRELWLLRHAESRQISAMEDFHRPLHERGVKEAKKLGSWMRRQQLLPDLWISSPAQRAMSTAEIVGLRLGIDKHRLNQDRRLYFQGIGAIKIVLQEIPKTNRLVLLVGHNPDFENLLAELLGVARVADGFPTAALARLAMPHDWCGLGSGCAELIALTNP